MYSNKMPTNKIHCRIYHGSVRGGVRWDFVSYFEGSNSRGQRQSRDISTQIYHVGEYILNSVCRGHDRHDFLMRFKLFTWHLEGTSLSSQSQSASPGVFVQRKDVSISQEEALSLFSPLRRSFGWTRNSPITQLEHIRTCLTLNPHPRFDTSTNQNQPTSCHLY